MLSSAHASAEQTINDANSHAENTVTTALAQAKQQLDDATARATAIHDGAERRLNLLISRHTETVRRLTEIRDVVTGLVSGETARGSLEDEVNRALGVQAPNGAAGQHDQATSGLPRVQAGSPESRRQAATAGPLDAQAAVPAARAGAAATVLHGGHDAADDDPLTGPVPDLHDGPRSPGHDAEAGSTTTTHPTEAAMKAAEEIRQAAEARRREAAGAGSPALPTEDRVLDETAAGAAHAVES
jgi:hypothetical protein